MLEILEINSEFTDLISVTQPINARYLSKYIPQVLRILSIKNQEEGIVTLEPQLGEMTRYGVFFSGVNQSYPAKLLDTKDYLYIDTNSLLTKKHLVDKSLVNKGVVVFPSPYYQHLSSLYLEKYHNPLDADCALNKENIVIDLGTTRRRIPPILSIPCRVNVDYRLFNRT